MTYSHEVEKMCPIAQGVAHGAAPIPEEAKWVKAKEIKVGEKRVLTARFYYPPTSGNEGQNQIMAFDLCADAVQTKNNPYRLFK